MLLIWVSVSVVGSCLRSKWTHKDTARFWGVIYSYSHLTSYDGDDVRWHMIWTFRMVALSLILPAGENAQWWWWDLIKQSHLNWNHYDRINMTNRFVLCCEFRILFNFCFFPSFLFLSASIYYLQTRCLRIGKGGGEWV